MEPPHGGDPPPPPPDRGPALWAEVRQYVSVPLQEELRLLGQAIREDARGELRGFLEEHLVPLGPPRPCAPGGEHQLGQLWAAGRSSQHESSYGLATTPCALIYSPGYTPSPRGVLWNNPARTDSKESIVVAERGPMPPGCCEDPLADTEAGVLEDEGRRVSWSATDAMMATETIRTVGGQSVVNAPSEPLPRGASKGQPFMRIPGPGHDAVKATEVSPMPPPPPPPQGDGWTARPTRQHSPKTPIGERMSLTPSMPVAWEVEANKSTASRVKSGVSRAVKDAKHHRRLPVLHPQGLFMSFWRPMMLFLTFFAVFSAPFDIAFWWEPPKLYKSAGYLVDVMFILDSLLQFRVAYVHFGGLELDPKKIAKHYVRTWLLPDVISNTPMDWFIGSAGKSRKLVKLMKLPKLIRLVKLIRLLKDQSHYIGVMSTLGLILLVSHYYACFWALTFLGSACDVGGAHCPNAWEAYTETLSVSVSSLTGNDGWTRFIGPEGTSRIASLRDPGSPLEVHEEFVVTIMTVIGLLILACLFGSVFAMMDGMNATGRAVMHKRLRLKREMEVAKVPKGLQVRVQATYEHLWQFGHLQRRGMLHDPVLSLDLRRRLALCAYGERLYKVPMFANLPDSDMMRICQKVEMRFFTPGDLIYHKGEKGEDMHFVTSGKVVALDDDEQVLKVYSVGDFFGEICFLSPGTDRSVTVRCEEFASTLMLRAQCFNELTMEDVLQRIRAEAHMAEIEYHRQHQRSAGSATVSKGG